MTFTFSFCNHLSGRSFLKEGAPNERSAAVRVSVRHVLSGWFAVLACLVLAGIGGKASAQDTPSIAVELNRLQQTDATCRLSLVFTNLLPVAIDALELETVLFDTEGRAGRFLILKSQPLVPGKVRVHQYDLDDTSCEAIGSVLINDVIACDGDGLNPAGCLSRLDVSSRENADLVLTVADRRVESATEPAASPTE